MFCVDFAQVAVWSFGILCTEILTKEDPYPGLDGVQGNELLVKIFTDSCNTNWNENSVS